VSRFLFHSLPLTGHVYPMSAVARRLADRGHEVAWSGSEAFLRPLLGPEVEVFPTGTRLYRGARRDQGLTAAKSRWQGYVVPVTKFTLAAVTGAAEKYQPDVLVVDQHATAGALVAHRLGLPWATMAPTTMEFGRPYRHLPTVEAWLQGLLRGMWTAAGLPGEPPHDLRFSPHLTISFTSEALAGPAPAGVVMVGPALGHRPTVADFPWDQLDPLRRKVLVTAGTLAEDLSESFYRRAAEALRPLADRVQAIVLAPEIPEVPPGSIAVPQVPMLDLMPHLDAAVTHGGLNTVCEALSEGVPLVVAPIKSDQPVNAAHVAAAGVGIRVKFHRVRPDELRQAVLTVLDDPSYRAAALRIAASFREAGGADAAADRLEQLVRSAVGGRVP
jgi:UDP:flavonoid glycosyltransferase YjiC (YdhE family)